MIKLGYEDIVANALIELDRRYGVRKVTMKQLDDYKNAVINNLKSKGIDVIYQTDQHIIEEIMCDYSKVFKYYDEFYETVVMLKNGISSEALVKIFRGRLSNDILSSFVDDEVLEALGKYEQVDPKLATLIDENTYFMIDVDGVCIDTEQRISEIANQFGWKEALENIDWHSHIFKSNQINNSLDILRDVQKHLKRISLLTTNNCREEEKEKVLYLRENGILLPVISVPNNMRKSQIVSPVFYDGNVILVDDMGVNVVDWNYNGGKGILFTDEEESSFVKVKSLDFLRNVK